GSFGRDAAAAVCALASGDVSVDDVVAALVAKSLVVVDRSGSEARFQLLETLRQYGEEKLDAGGLADAVRRRHLDHYVNWSTQAYEGILGPDEPRWHRAFEHEWHNVRSALRWACDTGDSDAALTLLGNVGFWASVRLRMEVADWIDEVLARTPSPDH